MRKPYGRNCAGRHSLSRPFAREAIRSGSPAIWQAEFTFKPKKPDVKPSEKTKKRVSALLGVVSCHFDIPQKAQSKSEVFDDITTKLNTGIAIVVPAHVIADLILEDPELKDARDAKFTTIKRA